MDIEIGNRVVVTEESFDLHYGIHGSVTDVRDGYVFVRPDGGKLNDGHQISGSFAIYPTQLRPESVKETAVNALEDLAKAKRSRAEALWSESRALAEASEEKRLQAQALDEAARTLKRAARTLQESL